MRNGTAAVVAHDARLTTPHSAFRIDSTLTAIPRYL